MANIEFQPNSSEPPLIASVRAYWTRKRGERALPRRQDILPSEIKPWLPFVLLVEVVDGGNDFRYRLVGSGLHQFFPAVPTGKLMTEILAPFGEETVRLTQETYRSVLTLGEPLRIKGDGAWYGQPPKYFEAILTPLSDDGAAVNMIFGAFDFLWSVDEQKALDQMPDDGSLNAAATILR